VNPSPPLHRAALAGDTEELLRLMRSGADVNEPDPEFHSPPAGWANEKGHEHVVAFLVSHGARMTACQAAAWGQRKNLLAMLDREPWLVNTPGNFGTPLHEAVIWGRLTIVKDLLARGADVTMKANDGSTALELALKQSANGRAYTPLVTAERKSSIEKNCAEIALLLRRVRACAAGQRR